MAWRRVGIFVIVLLLLLLVCSHALPQPPGNPVASIASQIYLANGAIRLTLLTDSLLRIEYQPLQQDGTRLAFNDEQTLVVWNRLLQIPNFSTSTVGNITTVKTSSFALTFDFSQGEVPSNANLRVDLLSPRYWSNVTSWKPDDSPEGNLYGTFHTLDTLEGWQSLNCTANNANWEGDDPLVNCAWGLVSKAGWALVDDSRSPSFVKGWPQPRQGSCSVGVQQPESRVPCFADSAINEMTTASSCVAAGCCYDYSPQPDVPLHLWYSPSRFDSLSMADCVSCENLYNYLGFQGYLFGNDAKEPGQRVALFNWWLARYPGGDNALVSHAPTGDRYVQSALVGYAWSPSRAQPNNTLPLKLWYSKERKDYFSTATPADEKIAVSNNYTFVELQGYINTLNTSSGWSDSAASCYQPSGNIDWYLFTHGYNYRAALADFSLIAGSIPIPRRHWLGMSWSRWGNEWTQALTYQQVQNLTAAGFPLSTYVFDMNWHLKPEWTGYTWDTSEYPDHVSLLKWLHSFGLYTGANLHDASGVMNFEERYPQMALANGVDPSTKQNVTFRISNQTYADSLSTIMLEPLAEEGLDFWWTDWQQGENLGVPDCYALSTTFLLNHYRFMNYSLGSRRGLIHSRFGGLGNHRYASGFGGDVVQSWESLQFMIYFTTTASNVLFGWWGHEMMQIQGAVPPTDEVLELFTRVMQFGAFSPVYTNWGNGGNPDDLWSFATQYLNATQKALMQRAQLLPYRYNLAREAFDTAVSSLRPMYYDYPLTDDAYNADLQYMLGSDMIVAPVCSPMDSNTSLAAVSVWFPKDENISMWYAIDDATESFASDGEWRDLYYPLDRIPVFVRAGAVLQLVAYSDAIVLGAAGRAYNTVEFVVYPPAMSGLTVSWMYEDDGLSNGYLQSEFAKTQFVLNISTVPLGVAGSCADMYIATSGNYSGMPTQRAYVIRLLASSPAPPQHVIVDSVALAYATSCSAHNTPPAGEWCLYDQLQRDNASAPQSLAIATTTLPIADDPLSYLSVRVCW